MGDVDKSWRSIRDFSLPEYSAYLRRLKRADERTRTADLISLRVCGSGLPSVARAYKSSITMAYVGKRISGHAPEAGGLSVSALLHVVSGGDDVLPPGYELT